MKGSRSNKIIFKMKILMQDEGRVLSRDMMRN